MKKKAIFTLFSTALLLGSTGISSVSVFADELPKTAEPTQPAPADPTEPTQPAPAEPTQPAPADPTEPTQPAPADPTEPTPT
ncbi:peptidase, partial [Staphylococcus aureus]|nr:peptidase [Staphylococcus aureus]